MYNLANNKKIDLISKLIIFYYFTTPFLYLLRTLSEDAGTTAVLLRSLEPILLTTTFFLCLLQNKFKLNRYIFTLLLVGIYGLIMAFANKNKLNDILAGYVHYMTGIILFIYYSNTNSDNYLNKFFNYLTFFAMLSYSLVIFLIYSIPYLLGIQIYLGLACQGLILIFFYNLKSRRFMIYLFALFLILVSGKRGVLVALGGGGMLFIILTLKKAKIKTLINGFISISLVIFLIINLSPKLDERLLNKYSFNQEDTVDDYSAGRWNEITSALDSWLISPENIIFGNGFGFTYTYVYSGSHLQDNESYKNIHFSYLNPVIILGIPIATIYYFCMLLLFTRMYRFVPKSLDYLRWSSLTYLIYACFVFNLFDEPIFWMINGIIYRSTKYSRNKTIGIHEESNAFKARLINNSNN